MRANRCAVTDAAVVQHPIIHQPQQQRGQRGSEPQPAPPVTAQPCPAAKQQPQRQHAEIQIDAAQARHQRQADKCGQSEQEEKQYRRRVATSQQADAMPSHR